MDKRLGVEIPVLDKGYIRVIEYMGNDSTIVNAARISYGKETKAVSTSEGLLDFLMRHGHSTPFEMPKIMVEVKLPFFIARQWMRYRTGTFNEISGRYTVQDDDYYIPHVNEVKHQSKANKQGSAGTLGIRDANTFVNNLSLECSNSKRQYDTSINELGVSRELARINTPLNKYTTFIWSTDAHNLMNFMKQRLGEGAQDQIQAYAKVMASIFKDWLPDTSKSFYDHRVHSVTFSGTEQGLLFIMISTGKSAVEASVNLRDGQRNEFLKKIAKINSHDLSYRG
jgi:thymidylate synthase (FAD)